MSLTSVTLSGTIKKQAEQRYTPNNNSVITFMMNIKRYDGRAKEEKNFPVKVNLWGDNFTDILDRLQEGTRVVVAGRLQMDQFNNKEGKMIRLLTVEASRINFADELAQGGYTASANSEMPDMEPAGSETDAFADQEVPF